MATPRGNGGKKPGGSPNRKGPNHGGSRPNTGPKPADLTLIRRDCERQIAEGLRPHVPMILEKLLALVEGVKVKEVGPDGTPDWYETPPNLPAIREALDRVAGKARQPIEVAGIELPGTTVVVHHENSNDGGSGPR